jgi:hypothetical protein
MGFPKGNNRVGVKSKNPTVRTKVPTEDILEAIRKCRGNLSRAADKLGICRQTLDLRRKSETVIQECLDTCRERFLDETEDVFQAKVLSGDTVSMLFALKTIGRKRGYDQDRDVIAESATRGALDFIFNRSKNPAES